MKVARDSKSVRSSHTRLGGASTRISAVITRPRPRGTSWTRQPGASGASEGSEGSGMAAAPGSRGVARDGRDARRGRDGVGVGAVRSRILAAKGGRGNQIERVEVVGE